MENCLKIFNQDHIGWRLSGSTELIKLTDMINKWLTLYGKELVALEIVIVPLEIQMNI